MQKSGDSEIRSLTGLRGVAALLVVPVHCSNLGNGQGLIGTFLFHGYLWVDLFLALSGFVLSERYGSAFRTSGLRRHILGFLIRRIARLWPMFALTTLFEFATQQRGLTWATSRPDGWAWLLAGNLLMVQAWLGMEVINVPGWSVSGEWACCLVFPFLQKYVFGESIRFSVAGYMLACLTVIVLATSSFPTRNGTLNIAFASHGLPVVRCLASFAMGMFARRLADYRRVSRITAAPAMQLIFFLVIMALFTRHDTDIAIVLLFPILIICLTGTRGPVVWVLSSPPLHFLGVISYSIYLLQVPIIILKGFSATSIFVQSSLLDVGLLQGERGGLIIFYAVLIAISAVTWYLIEQPSRKIRRGLRQCPA